MKLFLALMIAAAIPMTAMAQDDHAGMMVHNAYGFAAEKTIPASAVFMTLMNHTDDADRMIGFEMDGVGRTELHTMSMDNDVMSMRQVDGYDVPAQDVHVLKPMADHVMIFDRANDLNEGDTVSATALFEKAGRVPVDVTIKSRAEVMSNHMGDDADEASSDHEHHDMAH